MIKCHRKADSESETESLISSDRNNYASINRNNDLNNSFSQQFIDNNPIQTSFLFNRNIRIPNSNGLQVKITKHSFVFLINVEFCLE